MKKVAFILLFILISLGIFIACDNGGISLVNEIKPATTNGSSDGGSSEKTPILVVADAKDKFADDDDPILTYTTNPSPLPDGVSLTGVMTREAGEVAGVYAITQGTLKLTGKNASNYILSFTGSSLTIAEKDVVTIIIKDGLGKFEGEPDPEFTYAAGAFFVYPGVDALALRGLTITGALSRADGEVANTYAFSQGTIALTGETAGDYNLVFANIPGAVFTISAPGVITVIPNNVEKYYGEVDPALTYTFTPMLPAGIEFSGSLSRVNAGDPAGEAVGEYAITQNTLALTGEGSGNYNISFNDTKKLTIKKLPVTVTADSFIKVKGEAFPDLTFTNDRGLLVSDFTGALSCSAVDTSTTGNFPITRGTLALTGGAAANYAFEDATFVAGNLEVTAKTVITVTPNNQAKYYNDPDPAYTFTFTPTPEAGVTFDPATSLGRTAGETVGTYAINAGNLALQGTKKDNYTISVVNGKSLTISKKPVTITAYNRSKEYSDPDPELTFGSNPSLPPEAFTGSLAGTTALTVPGDYDITRGSLDLSTTSDGNGRYIDNYEITAFTKGTMSISKKTVKVTADAKTKVSGGVEPTLTFTVVPDIGAAAFDGALTRAAGEVIGQTYAISNGTLALKDSYSGNYSYNSSEDFTGALLTVTDKIPIEISADPKSKYYGDTDPSLTYTLAAALPAGVTVTGSLTRTAGENVADSPFAITKGTLDLSGANASNYTITFTPGAFTVNPKTVKVTANAQSKYYKDAVPALTYVTSPSLPAAAFTGGLECTATADSDAGTYNITKGDLALSTASDGNGPYNENYSYVPASDFTGSTLTVNKKPVYVTADNMSKEFDEDDPVFTYSTSPNLPAAAFSGALARAAGTAAGDYAINSGTLALVSPYTTNYEYNKSTNFTPGTFTIKPFVQAEVTVPFFRSMVQALYDSHGDVEKFGRSTTPPAGEYYSVDAVKLWYDEANKKITWFYGKDVEKAVKFIKNSGTCSMANFFKDCDKYIEISLEGFDTSLVDNMSSMFDGCLLLKSIDFKGIDTDNVEDMSYMFYKAGYNYFPEYTTGVGAENKDDNSENLVISNAVFNTEKVEKMNNMFQICAAVDLSGINMNAWDVSNVDDMSYMFAGHSIKSGGYKYWYTKFSGFDISNWVTSSCTTFRNMFALSNRFTELDISKFKFDNAVYLDRMFERCESLGQGTDGDPADDNKLRFPTTCYMKKVEDMLYMFGKCYEFRRENLKTIVESWDFTENATIAGLLAVNSNSDTTPEGTPSNRIIASGTPSSMHQNTGEHIRRNFKVQISMTTKDGKTLWIGGGTGIANCRLTTNKP